MRRVGIELRAVGLLANDGAGKLDNGNL